MASFFDEADERLYRWRRDNPWVHSRELKLFSEAFAGIDEVSSLLAVGMGEGADALFLRQVTQADMLVGIDLSLASLRFLRRQQPDWKIVRADGTRLPFADGSFDCVYCKDVCHHVEQPQSLIGEMWRVLRPGGHLVLIEANGTNPVIFLQGLAMPHERMVWRTSRSRLVRWVAQVSGVCEEAVAVSSQDPLPLWRVLLHYRFGIPPLGHNRTVRRILDGLDHMFGWILPNSRWSYLVAKISK